MAPSHQSPQDISWRRVCGLLGVVWGIAAISVCIVCFAFQRTDQLGLSLAIGAASLLISLLSIAPFALVDGSLQRPESASRFVHAALLSSGVRFSLTILVVVVLDKTGTAPRQTAGLWAIFWYSLLMATELIPVADVSTGGRLSFKRSTEEPGAR